MRARGVTFASLLGSAACFPQVEPFAPDAGPMVIREEPDAGLLDTGFEAIDAGEEAEPVAVGWFVAADGVPLGRDRHQMVYSPIDRQVLMLGGVGGRNNDAGVSDLHGDTWAWNGSVWEEKRAINSYGARVDHCASEDRSGRVILFGGSYINHGRGSDDLYRWDGTTWTFLDVPRPSARVFCTTAYDPDRELVVLYGGTGLCDTWEWDGTSWTQASTDGECETDGRPPATRGHRLYHDPIARAVMLYGGSRGDNMPLESVHRWDGARWQPVLMPNGTPGRSGAAVAYDVARSALVIFGGGTSATTFELVGGAWREIVAGALPHYAANPSAVYDRAAKQVVMFGGSWNESGWKHADETYVLRPVD